MENNIGHKKKIIQEYVRGIVEDWDCFVEFPHGNEHCILPEVYDDLTDDLVEFILEKLNETTY